MGGKNVKGVCFICKEEKNLPSLDNDKNRVCGRCYENFVRTKEICSVIGCGKLSVPRIRTEDGRPICNKCYNKYFRPERKKEICSVPGCGKFNIVQVRTEDGKPICKNCYNKEYRKTYIAPKELCSVSGCGKIGRIMCRTKDGDPVCRDCYEKFFQPKKMCSVPGCGFVGLVYDYDINGNPICKKCYMKEYIKDYVYPKEICSICGELRIVKKKDEEGRPICEKCYESNKYDTDDKFRIIKILRSRATTAFKLYSKFGKVKSSKKYGIDYEMIFEYLKPFPENIRDYNIDHIFPLSAFDFNDPIEIKIAFAPENHQWLKAKENLQKRAKYDPEELIEFKNKIREKYFKQIIIS